VPSAPDFVTVTAADLAYVNTNPVVKAGEVTVVLSNLDTGVPHDLSIDGVGVSGDCTGPCTVELHFSAIPGSYAFHCTFHPDMTGSLTVVP
jgi:plastocyanin